MKFNQQINNGALLIPSGVSKLSGFEAGEKVEIHALDSAVVVLKKQMTAMELIQAMDALYQLATELTAHLALACGSCDDCGDGCPFDDLEDGMLELPDYLRREACIPDGAKLCAYADDEEIQSPLAWLDMTTTCGMYRPTCWRCWLKPGSAWGSWRNT